MAFSTLPTTLATKLLKGEFKPGDRIKVVAHNGELGFEKK